MNGRRRETGSVPLSSAAFHGRLRIAKFLIGNGAKVSRSNRDGNTPLHVAAFLCRTDVVKLLLDEGASLRVHNERGERPADVVAGPWSDGLAGFYKVLSDTGGLDLDLDEIRKARPGMVRTLQVHAAESRQ
ncbi:MAG: ankyrin repeat domain-containing protein [Akkermansiaceae bacterium]|nr:ankyrin repeat domain-containing protein [Akkermansiaceae bacterium]